MRKQIFMRETHEQHQSFFSHPDCYRRLRLPTGSADPSTRRALAGSPRIGEYRRWGLSPRPENSRSVGRSTGPVNHLRRRMLAGTVFRKRHYFCTQELTRMNTALSLGYKSYPQEVVVMETTRNAGSCCGHHGATSAPAHRTAAPAPQGYTPKSLSISLWS